MIIDDDLFFPYADAVTEILGLKREGERRVVTARTLKGLTPLNICRAALSAKALHLTVDEESGDEE